ncbi:dehydrogenase [Corallococcus sp. H22C18031201]|uniref:YciI family protein n=1 Tax=Citreicoccus inhibens TaxID=2849499 RepID=UPI000E767100|nr:YciI family protein [Citreicoccus inhibens]MBU8895462.1 dehydrogenase [Citreicoccus inhibens]RJS22505.1 dehydrogenase [Corallococcus sp. H22C18031201]
MAFMLLVLESGEERRTRPPDVARRAFERMGKFVESVMARGVCKFADSLKSDAEGVRLTTRAGKPMVSDGPFTEAKEIVGGFFYLDVQTREEAMAIARECPASEWATLELRETGPCFY